MLPTPLEEANWSGRGQHAEFRKDEELEIPLKTERVLGSSGSAVVESVMCKRIRLARKTIQCGRRIKREDAIKEVELLQKLSHSHIVQAVGTYVMDKTLAILLYPATEFNLETFIEAGETLCEGTEWYSCLQQFFPCLANTLSYLHSRALKHMDIKPKNLLVRYVGSASVLRRFSVLPFKIYVADFGISRSYSSIADSETDSLTAFTRKYSAPEVVLQDVRGLSADIFSLGCVYAEMFAAMSGDMDGLDETLSRNEDGDSSYQANVEGIRSWLRRSPQVNLVNESVNESGYYVGQMLDLDPSKRPTAKFITTRAGSENCCFEKSDPLESATVSSRRKQI
jgi:serine/threonine protein kinase